MSPSFHPEEISSRKLGKHRGFQVEPAYCRQGLRQTGVNGDPLPQKHGFPLRLVYEDAYGYDWVKYVEEVVIS